MAALMLATPSSQAQTTREHRAVWLSPYLSQGWPNGKFTSESGVETQRNVLSNRLQRFKDQNINVIYFHVRSNCDAVYVSSYEPTSAQIAEGRGGEIVGDPLAMIVEEAHKVGIEVYAWFNPYRYNNNISFGSNPIEYENSHPEWLIKNDRQTTLNPGLEEVTQRICDVITEVVTKYDVDGVVFDDFFYPAGGTTTGESAPDYATYEASKTKLSMADWRRQNVNNMVRRVNQAIKAVKPWMPFGISPAGVANPSTVTSVYNLPPVQGETDWQYNQIYSDPLAWLKGGDIDFISPQIYWTSKFDKLSDWWANAARSFGRHSYPSVDISDFSKGQAEEMIRECGFTREVSGRDRSGFVFFHWGPLINNWENVFGTRKNLADNMALGIWTEKALTPLRPWNNSLKPAMVANVRRDGDNLTWDAVEGMRYTVYAVPEGTEAAFASQREFLDGIAYTNSYAIPREKASGYTFAVAVYDRYGNEYAPLFEGQTAATLPAPSLTYPADASEPGFMFEFAWQSQGVRHIFELADNAEFNASHIIEVAGNTLPVSDLPRLESGRTYYWRVHLSSPNAQHVTSDARSFTASEISFVSPAQDATDQPYDNLEIVWNKAPEGTDYTLTLSDREDMTSPAYTATFHDTDRTVIPARVLFSGHRYYMTVSAVNGKSASTSNITSFTTVEKTDYAAPVFVSPANPGEVVHSNQPLRVAEYSGLRNVEISVSSSASFPTRSTRRYTITDFSGATDPMGECKISSKSLEGGKTYYVRARGGYYTLGSSEIAYTPYAETTFVYSAEAGIGDVSTDSESTAWVDANSVLHFAAGNSLVEVYGLDGRKVFSIPAEGVSADLSALPAGVYLIRVIGACPANIKWVR